MILLITIIILLLYTRKFVISGFSIVNITKRDVDIYNNQIVWRQILSIMMADTLIDIIMKYVSL